MNVGHSVEVASRLDTYSSRWSIASTVSRGPLRGTWLFAWMFAAQLGHLVEHIAKALTGSGLLGSGFDNETSHLIFNGAIALLALVAVGAYPRNPWVYPLALLAVFHEFEHVYIFEQYLRTGITGGPGLLGIGGAIGLVPLERIDLHNVYNGLEVVLMTLGLGWEGEKWIDPDSAEVS